MPQLLQHDWTWVRAKLPIQVIDDILLLKLMLPSSPGLRSSSIIAEEIFSSAAFVEATGTWGGLRQ